MVHMGGVQSGYGVNVGYVSCFPINYCSRSNTCHCFAPWFITVLNDSKMSRFSF